MHTLFAFSLYSRKHYISPQDACWFSISKMESMSFIKLETSNTPAGRSSLIAVYLKDSCEILVHGGILDQKETNEL